MTPDTARTAPDIVLGVDPGLRRTGFGLVRRQAGRLTYIASGTIRTPDADLATRLGVIHAGLAEIIGQYRPGESAIEKVFVNVNPASTLLLGQARGAAITALVAAGLPVHEYTALQLKQSVVGHGHAGKGQIAAMVQRLLMLPGPPAADAADALACAICHIHAAKFALGATAAAGATGLAIRRRGARIRGGRVV
ncbi:MAG: crossover junction endodeoxyribonuclease RuvC [Pseudomonadota bacterium]|nr:crossover junction endodeoxyribonuclease RuvC [Pseudomonadota bacterium]